MQAMEGNMKNKSSRIKAAVFAIGLLYCPAFVIAACYQVCGTSNKPNANCSICIVPSCNETSASTGCSFSGAKFYYPCSVCSPGADEQGWLSENCSNYECEGN